MDLSIAELGLCTFLRAIAPLGLLGVGGLSLAWLSFNPAQGLGGGAQAGRERGAAISRSSAFSPHIDVELLRYAMFL